MIRNGRIIGMSRIVLTILLIAIACVSQSNAAEVIGPHEVRAPDSAVLVDGPLDGTSDGWLNVIDVAIDINTSFAGESIIDDGYANVRAGNAVEVLFRLPVVNVAGPDLVLYDARFDEGAYVLRTEFDNFVFGLDLHEIDDFISTGESRNYFYGRNDAGPFLATIYAAEIDLSDLGVPIGSSVHRVRFSATNSDADPIGIGALVPSPSTFALLVGFGIATVCHRTRNESQ